MISGKYDIITYSNKNCNQWLTLDTNLSALSGGGGGDDGAIIK